MGHEVINDAAPVGDAVDVHLEEGGFHEQLKGFFPPGSSGILVAGDTGQHLAAGPVAGQVVGAGGTLDTGQLVFYFRQVDSCQIIDRCQNCGQVYRCNFILKTNILFCAGKSCGTMYFIINKVNTT